MAIDHAQFDIPTKHLGKHAVFHNHVMAANKSDSSDKPLPWGLSPEGLAPGSMKVRDHSLSQL